MSKNLEPGDLAIIIKSLDGHATGKIVECVRIDGIHSQYGVMWLVISKCGDLISEYGGVGRSAHCPQDWLRKIPNDPLPDEEDSLNLETEEHLETIV